MDDEGRYEGEYTAQEFDNDKRLSQVRINDVFVTLASFSN